MKRAAGRADGRAVMAATCVRRAWLTLGAASLALEDAAAGYLCTSLDLGYPTPRPVTANRPDADGAVDRTRYSSPRTVAANISALVGAGARIDEVATAFRAVHGGQRSADAALHSRPARRRRTHARAGAVGLRLADCRTVSTRHTAPMGRARSDRTRPGAAQRDGVGRRTRRRPLYDLAFDRTYPQAGGGRPAASSRHPATCR